MKSQARREKKAKGKKVFVFIIKNRFEKKNLSFTAVNESFSINFEGAMTSPLDSYEVQPATFFFFFNLFLNKQRNSKMKNLRVWQIPGQQLNINEEIHDEKCVKAIFQ